MKEMDVYSVRFLMLMGEGKGREGCVRIEYGNIALKPVNDFVDSILVLILGELEIN